MDLFQLIGKIAIQNSEANSNIDETADKAEDASKKVEDFGDEGEKTESKFSKAFSKIGKVAVGVGKAVGTALVGASAAVIKLGKEAITTYADYEQLVGGVETLFGTGGLSIEEYAKKVGKSVDTVKSEYARLETSQKIVLANADDAYKNAGMSANTYMETVTSFSASLLQGLNGDTIKAAQIADKAIVAMSDNANKMGTDISAIQNAYQGFAKQNYTMLDNLKLGYGGTASEMARLINDSGVLGSTMKITANEVNNVSFDKIIEAIGVVQDRMGITGTTAKEAASTIQGSVGMMKGSWENLLVGLADDTQDFDTLLNNFVESVITVFNNLLPRISIVVQKIPVLIEGIIKELPGIIRDILPAIVSAAVTLINGVIDVLPQIIDGVTALLPELISALLNMLPKLLDAVIKIVTELISALGNMLPDVINQIVTLIPEIIDVLIGAIPQLLDAAITLLMAIVDALPTIIDSLNSSLPQIITTIVNALIVAIPKLINGAIELFNAIIKAIPKFIPFLIEAIPTIVTSLVEGLITCIPELVQGAIELFYAIIFAIPEFITALIPELPRIIEAIVTNLINSMPVLFEASLTLFGTIVSVIPQIAGQVFSKATGIVSSIINGISSLPQKGLQVFNNLKTKVIGKIDELKNNAKQRFEIIKNSITQPIQKAMETIKGMVDKIKGFFNNMKISLPKIKLPHFKVEGKLSISPPSVPKLSIEWYKKAYDKPMLLNNPTIFGYNPSTGSFMGGGDAPNKGAEVISGAKTLMTMVQNAVSTENSILQFYLEKIMALLAELLDGLPEWLNVNITTDDGLIIAHYAPGLDKELGKIKDNKKRGR